MIRQDDERIKSEWINKYGCAFISVLYYVNKFTNLSLSPAKIEIYFEQMKQAGCFTEDLDIIWEKAFEFFDMKVAVTFKDDKYKLKKHEFAIAKWYNEKTNLSHFCPTENNVCLFDSLGDSVTVKEGCVESYRVFKRK